MASSQPVATSHRPTTAQRSSQPWWRSIFGPGFGRRMLMGYLGLIYLFLFLPILLVIITSFNPDGRATFPPAGVTGQWYQDLINDGRMLRAFRTSISVALIVTVIATTLGLMAAWGLSRMRFWLRGGIRGVFLLPMLVPGVVGGISLLLLFDAWNSNAIREGIFGSRFIIRTGFWTIVMAHVINALPYAVTLILTSFAGFDRRLEEASRDLGANEWHTFRRVTLPLVMPGVIGGALLAFTISFDEFVVTFFVAGGGVQTLPVEIYSRIRFEFSPVINAAATVVIGASLIVLLLGQVLLALRKRGTA